MASLLGELAERALERVFVLGELTLRNRPRAFVLARPEGPAGMGEQFLPVDPARRNNRSPALRFVIRPRAYRGGQRLSGGFSWPAYPAASRCNRR